VTNIGEAICKQCVEIINDLLRRFKIDNLELETMEEEVDPDDEYECLICKQQ
jgi:hypothetical protein